MTRQNIVFLTGAGISAESGLATFRDKNGLWTNENWMNLAHVSALRLLGTGLRIVKQNAFFYEGECDGCNCLNN